MSPIETLVRLGYDPEYAPAPSPPGSPVASAGAVYYVAGQIPLRDGAMLACGTVGDQVDVELARECARQATANALAQLHGHLGSLEGVRAVRLTVYVSALPGFSRHSDVAQAASSLLLSVLGDRGDHSRVAIGVTSLPRTSPVEVELVATTD